MTFNVYVPSKLSEKSSLVNVWINICRCPVQDFKEMPPSNLKLQKSLIDSFFYGFQGQLSTFGL